MKNRPLYPAFRQRGRAACFTFEPPPVSSPPVYRPTSPPVHCPDIERGALFSPFTVCRPAVYSTLSPLCPCCNGSHRSCSVPTGRFLPVFCGITVRLRPAIGRGVRAALWGLAPVHHLSSSGQLCPCPDQPVFPGLQHRRLFARSAAVPSAFGAAVFARPQVSAHPRHRSRGESLKVSLPPRPPVFCWENVENCVRRPAVPTTAIFGRSQHLFWQNLLKSEYSTAERLSLLYRSLPPCAASSGPPERVLPPAAPVRPRTRGGRCRPGRAGERSPLPVSAPQGANRRR